MLGYLFFFLLIGYAYLLIYLSKTYGKFVSTLAIIDSVVSFFGWAGLISDILPSHKHNETGYVIFILVFVLLSILLSAIIVIKIRKHKIAEKQQIAPQNVTDKKEMIPVDIEKTITGTNIDEPNNIIYCKYCGTRLDANSVFCKKCGKKLDDSYSKDLVSSSGLVSAIKQHSTISLFSIIWILFNLCLLTTHTSKNAMNVLYPFNSSGKLKFSSDYYDGSDFIFYVIILPLIIYYGHKWYIKHKTSK